MFRRDVCRYTNRRVHESVAIASGRAGWLVAKLRHYSIWDYDRYLTKIAHYTRLGALDLHDRGRRAGFAGMFFRVPLRFLQLYVFRLGFLDGLAGLQICMLTAMTGFLKQARLWELDHAQRQPDPEVQPERRAA